MNMLFALCICLDFVSISVNFFLVFKWKWIWTEYGFVSMVEYVNTRTVYGKLLVFYLVGSFEMRGAWWRWRWMDLWHIPRWMIASTWFEIQRDNLTSSPICSCTLTPCGIPCAWNPGYLLLSAPSHLSCQDPCLPQTIPAFSSSRGSSHFNSHSHEINFPHTAPSIFQIWYKQYFIRLSSLSQCQNTHLFLRWTQSSIHLLGIGQTVTRTTVLCIGLRIWMIHRPL